MDMEKLGFQKVELTENQSTLIEKLRAFEADNSLVKKIIRSVEYGFSDSAKTLCWNEADKFRGQPEVIEILRKYLFDENEDKPWTSRRKK